MIQSLTNDKYTKLNYDRDTGKYNRQWIHYADNTFEPVRLEGDLRDKYHANNAMTDWWMTEKPQDWNPLSHGFDVSLNHDFYGGGNTQKSGYANPKSPGLNTGQPPRIDFSLPIEDLGKEHITLFSQPLHGPGTNTW